MDLVLKLMDERNDKGAKEVVRSVKGELTGEGNAKCQVKSTMAGYHMVSDIASIAKASDAAEPHGADRAHQTWTTDGIIRLIPCRQAAYLCPD